MDLKDQIFAKMKAAMKEKNQSRVAALRLIRDAIQKHELNENVKLDDAGVTGILARLVKQREESIQAYEAGRRPDLADRERAELGVIGEFMPEPLSGEGLVRLVDEAIAEAGAKGPSDMGLVMKTLKGRYEGRASGKDVSNLVKERLNKLNA